MSRCNDASCGGADRREFLAGLGAAALGPAIAGPFDAVVQGQDGHFVPADKKLDPRWVQALFARGEPTVYGGERRAAVAMPCGGIGAGQLYVGGDGTLRHWQLDHEHVNTGYGLRSYEFRVPPRVVDQGFALALRTERGWDVRRLREEDVPDVEFQGEYPVAEVRYPAGELGVDVVMQVFSPFVPLDADASTLPATVMKLTLRNTTDRDLTLRLYGWLENAVMRRSGADFGVRRVNRVEVADGQTRMMCGVELPGAVRGAEPDVFADFEGDDYGDWVAEGAALGARPSRGTHRGQNPVSGQHGAGLVNTYLPGDEATGTLTSPELTIRRPWINFLIGGGAHRGETCIELLVDGEVVRAATGRETERLQWAAWRVDDLIGRTARIRIADRATGPWGHVNVDRIELADAPKSGLGGFGQQGDHGGTGLVAFAEAARHWPAWDGAQPLAEIAGGADPEPAAGHPRALCELDVSLARDGVREVTFALVWHFPNREAGVGYARRFADAAAVADHVAAHRERLVRDTLNWRDTFYRATSLPAWLCERIHAPVSTLATETVQIRGDGRFWAWEGVGCCAGTCTHVWNYEQALARLFPALARTTREQQDLGDALREDGLVAFRGRGDAYAADGQAGTVLKVYREHLTGGDDGFLERVWLRTKRALEYLIARDGDGDGLIEDAQHNTYDIEFHGANTFVGALYLAALRAGAEMARRIGDGAFAARCEELARSGGEQTMARLWNGDYFAQAVDLERHPRWQYANGCLADQLFGQQWAHQLGLGYLYPRDAVRSAIAAVYRHNWAPDVGPQNARYLPERYFARRGQAGLFLCTWPHGGHLDRQGVRYRNEVWTGIEYQVAAHLVFEGFVEEGLAVVRGVHERYDGYAHNPWNEVECGEHYARALASWGVLIALSGFELDGPAGVIGFDPRLDGDDFACPFVAASGFGTYWRQRTAAADTHLVIRRHGTVALRELRLRSRWAEPRAGLVFTDRPLTPTLHQLGDGRVALRFADPVELGPGGMLRVELTG